MATMQYIETMQGIRIPVVRVDVSLGQIFAQSSNGEGIIYEGVASPTNIATYSGQVRNELRYACKTKGHLLSVYEQISFGTNTGTVAIKGLDGNPTTKTAFYYFRDPLTTHVIGCVTGTEAFCYYTFNTFIDYGGGSCILNMEPQPIPTGATFTDGFTYQEVLCIDSNNKFFVVNAGAPIVAKTGLIAYHYANITGIGSGPWEDAGDVLRAPENEESDFMKRFNPRVQTSNIGLYKLTKAEVKDVMDDIWTRGALEALAELMTGSGAGALQGCYWYYGLNSNISTAASTNKVHIGKNAIGTTQKTVINKEFVELPMGSVAVPAYYGDARDYATTTYQLYIPFIGLIDLQAIDVLGYTIFLEYRINLSDGSSVVQIYRERAGGRYYIYTGDCQFGYSIPLQAEPTKDAISWAVGVVKGNFDNTTGEKYSVGSFASSANVMSDFTPYLYVTRKAELSDTDFANYKGLPANVTRSMVEFSGYVEVADVINAGTLPTRRNQDIVDLLKGGVYI